jgi:hypothetical protein
MQTMTYKGVKVQYDDSITEEEARELTRAEKNDWWENLNKIALGYLTITREGNEIVLHGKEAPPIERLRRITGYCSVSTRWNNSKKAELKDRVKHA